MTDFEKRVRKVLAEKPFVLLENGKITTDKTYTIDDNPITQYVFSGKTDELILATGDTRKELEELYKGIRKDIDERKESMINQSGGFLCPLQCDTCNSHQRVACYERNKEND